MTNANKTPFDVYQTITDRIVSAIEAGAPTFVMPWHSQGTGTLPVNVLTNNSYRGINILSLWVAQLACGFRTNKWGTYRQWKERGGQVRKGEKASVIVFYKEFERDSDTEAAENECGKVVLARASFVFNADQVDGYTLPELPVLEDKTVAIERADRFVKATNATVQHGGVSACYHPQTDTIQMPERNLFTGTKSRTPTEAYYGTLLHELTHWTSHPGRVNRSLSKRFGNRSYAMEELVAEFGAAFLCARLGVSLEPRADHAAYLDQWLGVIKADKKALFAAASKASEAVEYLAELQPEVAKASVQQEAA